MRDACNKNSHDLLLHYLESESVITGDAMFMVKKAMNNCTKLDEFSDVNRRLFGATPSCHMT